MYNGVRHGITGPLYGVYNQNYHGVSPPLPRLRAAEPGSVPGFGSLSRAPNYEPLTYRDHQGALARDNGAVRSKIRRFIHTNPSLYESISWCCALHGHRRSSMVTPWSGPVPWPASCRSLVSSRWSPGKIGLRRQVENANPQGNLVITVTLRSSRRGPKAFKSSG